MRSMTTSPSTSAVPGVPGTTSSGTSGASNPSSSSGVDEVDIDVDHRGTVTLGSGHGDGSSRAEGLEQVLDHALELRGRAVGQLRAGARPVGRSPSDSPRSMSTSTSARRTGYRARRSGTSGSTPPRRGRRRGRPRRHRRLPASAAARRDPGPRGPGGRRRPPCRSRRPARPVPGVRGVATSTSLHHPGCVEGGISLGGRRCSGAEEHEGSDEQHDPQRET